MNSASDFSDASDVEQEDYKSLSKRKKASGKADGKGSYKIRNVLKVPRATTYTAQALFDQMTASDIDLEPQYQRDVVWPEIKQIGIIDSILRNYYVPPVIFAVNTSEDGSETKTCIDGKQRLTSIHKFMSGLIPHKDPHTGEKLWYKSVKPTEGKGSRTARNLLPEKYRRLFANKQIVCVEYQDITDGDEREIFQRVQLGMALTPAEKLQVTSSPRANFIRSLQDIYLHEENGLAGDALEWDRTRGSDFRCLAQAVYCIEKYPNTKNVGTITQLEKWLNLPDEVPSRLTDQIRNTYDVFRDLVHDPILKKAFQKPAKMAPVEFICITLLLAVHKDKLTLAQLSSAISALRDNVRKEHVDIRMNDRVAKTMLQFIRTLKVSELKGPVGEPAGSIVGKRKREEIEDEDVDSMVKAKNISVPALAKSSSSKSLPNSSAIFHDIPRAPSSRPPVQPPPPPDRIAAIRAAKEHAPNPSHFPPTHIPASARLPALPASFPKYTPSAPRHQIEASLITNVYRHNRSFDHALPIDRQRNERDQPPSYPQERQDTSYLGGRESYGNNTGWGNRHSWEQERNRDDGWPPPTPSSYSPNGSEWATQR